MRHKSLFGYNNLTVQSVSSCNTWPGHSFVARFKTRLVKSRFEFQIQACCSSLSTFPELTLELCQVNHKVALFGSWAPLLPKINTILEWCVVPWKHRQGWIKLREQRPCKRNSTLSFRFHVGVPGWACSSPSDLRSWRFFRWSAAELVWFSCRKGNDLSTRAAHMTDELANRKYVMYFHQEWSSHARVQTVLGKKLYICIKF